MRNLIAVCAVMLVGVGTAAANTVESSTMYFAGSLADAGGGVYVGTVDACAGTFYAPGGPGTVWDEVATVWRNPDGTVAIGGFDVYAREGGTAYYDDAVQGTIGADHDAYSNAGGWGAFYTPDVQDYYNYQLVLTADAWYLQYKSVYLGTPMSGALDWYSSVPGTGYASEDDTGAYLGTIPTDPDANDGDAAANGGGAGAWDMDWTWGSEVIPLEMPGFHVKVDDLGCGQFMVTMTPVPEPATMTLLGLGLLGLVVRGKRQK